MAAAGKTETLAVAVWPTSILSLSRVKLTDSTATVASSIVIVFESVLLPLFDFAVIVTVPAFNKVIVFPSIEAIVVSDEVNSYFWSEASVGLIVTVAVIVSPTLPLFLLKDNVIAVTSITSWVGAQLVIVADTVPKVRIEARAMTGINFFFILLSSHEKIILI